MNLTALSLYTRFALLAPAWLPLVAASRALTLDDPTCRHAGHALRSLARTVVGDIGVWDFAIEGDVPPDLGRQPCVVVANHASLADPFLLAHLPFDLRFVAKQELFALPLVGWLLRLGGDLPVHRGDHASAERMTAAAEDTIRHGLSVMIFPEGTRSRSGALGRFRDGAFRIAIETGARVLPVALHGTAACIGSGGPRRARARAEILPPIDTTGLGAADLGFLRETTRARIASALDYPSSRALSSHYFLDCPVEVEGDRA
jgi:1-acyl-sn-glycerol-3-phosphate acyltransferase